MLWLVADVLWTFADVLWLLADVFWSFADVQSRVGRARVGLSLFAEVRLDHAEDRRARVGRGRGGGVLLAVVLWLFADVL